MLTLILLCLHLPRAWRSALFPSSCVCFRFHSTGTMPRRTAAGRRPHPTRARSRSANAGTTDPPTAASFRSMSVYDLRHTCRSAGLASEGTKHQLINRLCAHHGVDSPSANPPANPPDPPSVTGAAVLSAQLQAEIQRAVSTAIADLAPALRPMEPRTSPGNPGTSQSDSDLTIVPTPPPGPSSLTTGVLPISSPLAVPARLSDRILRGEFIELDDLLPDELGNPARNSFELVPTSEGLSLRESTARRQKRHVDDLTSWLEAWTVYCSVVLSAAPHRCQELLAYQAIIATASRQFYPEAWLSYDRQFRRAAAGSTALRWNTIDPTLWQLTMTGKARPSCPTCHTQHHGRCSFRGDAFRPSQARQPDARHKDGRAICRNFNFHRCSNRACPRAHVCLTCGGKHPSVGNHTSTTTAAAPSPSKQ